MGSSVNKKTEQQINDDILQIKMKIQEKYPELTKYIEEMTISIPYEETPEINSTILENYYDSVVSMMDGYSKSHSMNSSKNISPFWKLIIAIIICEGVGITSGLISSADMNTWFATLNKPTWNPPAYLFAPVWTILYFLMGISLWLIWKNNAPELNKRNAYYLFTTQLFLNFWWSIIFFKFHSPGFALLDIIAMLVLITLTIISFSKFSKPAAWLLVPYITWVSFATFLNYSIWILNR